MNISSSYPFSGIVGQSDAKLALVLSAIDPGMGGVLLTGQKGTGKSTLVRAMPQILPSVLVNDCSYHCLPHGTLMCPDCMLSPGNPFELKPALVNVPLGTDQDSLLGAVKMDTLLREGKVEFEPGLLALANNQVLYIDEVNLLPDNIADNILDCAASGVNSVEKDNISVTHPAKFILLGTMNPEEGRLRPQILDRFAMSVSIETIDEPKDRIEIVQRVLAYSESPADFNKVFSKQNEVLQNNISLARSKLSSVGLPMGMLGTVAAAMAGMSLDGQRADIVTLRAARALAAFDNKSSVTFECLEKVAPMCVSHRTREGGLKSAPDKDEILKALQNGYSNYGKGKDSGKIWNWRESLESQS